MEYADFAVTAQQCAPAVHHKTMLHLARAESSLNEFAIGVVGGRLKRQPRNLDEAVATAKVLIDKGINFSAGVVQVNYYNWRRFNLDVVSVFNPCKNLSAGSGILRDCFHRAEKQKRAGDQGNIQFAFSCYYSNNFTTGFREGYVQTILKYAAKDLTLAR